MAAPTALPRIARLYGMIEQMRSLERRMAESAVNDVACVEAIQTTVREREIFEGRTALGAGDRAEWTIAEIAREVADMRLDQLARVRGEREVVLEDAILVHRASRLRLEQMNRIVDHADIQARVEAGREAQSIADDRYASRRAWASNARKS